MNSSLKENKIVIGFIIYGNYTAKYLPYFLLSLKEQVIKNSPLGEGLGEGFSPKIIAFNNGEAEDDNVKYLRANYPEVEIMGGGANLGFAGAYNKMIARANELGGEYFLVTNADMVYEKDSLKKLMAGLGEEKTLVVVCPKILKWHFALNVKTKIIDSCGIALKNGLRFFDVGQGKLDREKYYQTEIIGPSGASGLFRLSFLEKIKDSHGYFDERFFMYKEDCDLAYRLKLAGLKTKFIPEAVVYHDRSASGVGESNLAIIEARKNKSRQVKAWSFRNQQLLFKKYWGKQSFISKLAIIWFEISALVYVLFFERFLLKEYRVFFEVKVK